MFWNKKEIKHLKESNEAYREEIAKLRAQVKEKEETVKIMRGNSDRLISENEKLIKWIHEILNTIGTRDIDGTFPISIPVYKDLNEFGYINGRPYKKEEIVVPEIRIVSTRCM